MRPGHIQVTIDVVHTPDYSSFAVNKWQADKDHSAHRLARLRVPLFSELELMVLVLPNWAILFCYAIYLFPCA